MKELIFGQMNKIIYEIIIIIFHLWLLMFISISGFAIISALYVHLNN